MAIISTFSFGYSPLALFIMTVSSKGCSVDVLFQSVVALIALSVAVVKRKYKSVW